MALHSETKTLSSSYAEVKELVRLLVEDLNEEEIKALTGLIIAIEKHLPREEDIFILKDGVSTSYQYLLDLNSQSTDESDVDISIGFNRLRQIYEKIRAATSSTKEVSFVFKDYIHNVVKQALRRTRKKYSSGNKSEINLSCVSKIDDNLIVMYLAWDWKLFITGICKDKVRE